LFFKENVSSAIYKERGIQKKETIYNEKKKKEVEEQE
jgi:hypothetical protein